MAVEVEAAEAWQEVAEQPSKGAIGAPCTGQT